MKVNINMGVMLVYAFIAIAAINAILIFFASPNSMMHKWFHALTIGFSGIILLGFVFSVLFIMYMKRKIENKALNEDFNIAEVWLDTNKKKNKEKL